MTNITKKTNALIIKAANKVSTKLRSLKDDNGGFEVNTEHVIMIVAVCIVAAIVVLPAVTTWFKTTVIPGLTEKTTALFNFKVV